MANKTRILLKPKYRKHMFQTLLEIYKVKNFQELAKKLDVSPSCIKKWRKGVNYTPREIFQNLLQPYMIQDEKQPNWGCKKGGKKGIKKLLEKYPSKINEWRQKGGKKSALKWNDKEKAQKVAKKISQAQTKNRLEKISKRVKKNKGFFQENKPRLNSSKISFSKRDREKEIKLPETLTEPLAEEIGVHIGDGTLLRKKNYFSVRGGINETEYYKKYLQNLYQKVYNLKPRIFIRDSVCGFEIYSKAIFKFKKSIGLPDGKKARKIDIPEVLRESQDKNSITACIRGIFDTDGFFYAKDNKEHPRINIFSMSTNLIEKIEFYLKKLGFEPHTHEGNKVVVYGWPMVLLWIEKVGTNNPKHQRRIRKAARRARGLAWIAQKMPR